MDFSSFDRRGYPVVSVEKWLAGKPKWCEYLNWPVSFALVWTK